MQLKGIQNDLVLALDGGNWSQMMSNLAEQLENPDGIINRRGSHVWLDAADCPPGAAELEQLAWLLELHGMHLDWWTDAVEARNHSPVLGKPDAGLTRGAVPAREPSLMGQGTGSPSLFEDDTTSQAAFISRTLRSGQVVHHAGTVVVFGDVNPGAVIVAGGTIIVWGRLRGIVHAGASGDATAMVGALEFAPSQLRIADRVSHAPDANKGLSGGAELARVRGAKIVIEDWDYSKR